MSDVTAVIRFKDSEDTLPEVIRAIKNQTTQPNRIIGVNTGSKDSSSRLLSAAGAEIISWDQAYHHSKVLNFATSHCTTPYTLCLSSHTVMLDALAIERLLDEIRSDDVACCSVKWNNDPYYSNKLSWQEVQAKGLKFGSIYTNSMGIFRTDLWKEYPFDETIFGVEDYDWAIHHLKKGFHTRRIESPISYLRKAHNRDFRDSARVFHIARRYGLKVKWLGSKSALYRILKNLPGWLSKKAEASADLETCTKRLSGALLWRFIDLNR